MVEAVKEVFAAEKKAAEIIAHAQQKKEKIIADAKLSAVKLLEEEKQKIDAQSEKELGKKHNAIEAERKQILEQAREQTIKLKKKAQTNVAKAVTLVLKELDAA